MKIAIIGAGAAGVFCAANIVEEGAEVVVLESGMETLRKVLQSGGGRCNITNSERDIGKFIKNYPRGGGSLRKPLRRFGPQELLAWFGERGVEFVEEDCGRIFPKSEESEEIADCLTRECAKRKVRFQMPFTAMEIVRREKDFLIRGRHGDFVSADKVLISVGGRWQETLQKSLEEMGHEFAKPLPSLFAFKTSRGSLDGLAGAAFKNAKISCRALGLEDVGEILITHEGLSGPAVLRLSSRGALKFYECDYKFDVELSTMPDAEAFKKFCESARKSAPKKLVKNFHPDALPKSFWNFVLEKAGVAEGKTWAQFSATEQKNVAQLLLSLPLAVVGRAVNAREFVTCGGLDLKCVDFTTMQSRIVPNLYFAGECLDIDGFTGGYNLQAAWTTGYIAAKAMEKNADKNV